MSLNVSNCPRCGKIFIKGIHDICSNCLKDIDNQHDKCSKYLRENRKCTLQELSDATEVTISQITKFIREGRISIVSHPNMVYSCEVCGTSIRNGSMCDSCRANLMKDANHMLEDDARKKSQQQWGQRTGFNIKDRLHDRR